MTKKILDANGIDFDYKLFSSLDNQLEVRKMAMSKGMASFPLIMKDGELVELSEVLGQL